MDFGPKKKFVKLSYLIPQVFLAWTFLNFLAHCGVVSVVHLGYGGYLTVLTNVKTVEWWQLLTCAGTVSIRSIYSRRPLNSATASLFGRLLDFQKS